MAWPHLESSAPGRLIRTSGTEWLPSQSALPVEFAGDAYLPDPLPGKFDFNDALPQTWSDIERAVAALSGLVKQTRTLPNPHLLTGLFRLREAQASSRIENTIASAEEVALVDVGEVSRDESVEVKNYIRATEFALGQEYPISNGLIKSMHQLLMQDGARGSELRPGQYRLAQAYIGGEKKGFEHARFVPPPGEHVQLAMDDLVAFIRDEAVTMPAVMATAMVHYQFETIHPFSDGNGRLGRMLIQVQLNRAGYLERPILDISSFFDRFRDEYYDLLLGVSTQGAWLDWIRFFCRGIAHQAMDAERRADELLALRRDYMDRVTEPRASALLRETVDYLFSRPAIRTNDLAEHLNIKHNAAQRHVNRLVEKQILTEVTGRSSHRVYVAKGVLAVIEREYD